MVRDADMPDIALFPHLQRRGKGAIRVVNVRQNRWIVKLEEVNVIRPQSP